MGWVPEVNVDLSLLALGRSAHVDGLDGVTDRPDAADPSLAAAVATPVASIAAISSGEQGCGARDEVHEGLAPSELEVGSCGLAGGHRHVCVDGRYRFALAVQL